MLFFAPNKLGFFFRVLLVCFQMTWVIKGSLIKDSSNKMSMNSSNDSYKDMSQRKLSNEQQMKLD